MSHAHIIASILSLPWENADPKEIILVSRAIAKEFADSLRRSQVTYPNDARIQEVAAGELHTNNLNYAEYSQTADHWQFLDYFVGKAGLSSQRQSLTRAIETYCETMNSFTVDETIMLISSREKETGEMYLRILASHTWDALGYGFYAYYLARHVELDSDTGGHADILSHIPIDQTVLTKGYAARLKLYSELFTK